MSGPNRPHHMKSTQLLLGILMTALALTASSADLTDAVQIPAGGHDLLAANVEKPLLPKEPGHATAGVPSRGE